MGRIKMLQQLNQLGTVDKWVQDNTTKYCALVVVKDSERRCHITPVLIFPQVKWDTLNQQDHKKTGISKS